MSLFAARLDALAASGRAPALALALGLALTLPGLFGGFALDDHFQRLALSGAPQPPGLPASALDLYAFASGRPADNRAWVDLGLAPWWTLDDLRFSFGRPLASATRLLDHALWPQSAFVAHLHSWAWYGLTILAVGALYRRWLGDARLTALALLLFAIDESHGPAAGWLANRHALLATALGAFAVTLHLRHAAGHAVSRWAAPAAALVALSSSEAALPLFALAAGRALAGAGPWRRRAGELLPLAAAFLAWAIAYKALGYGVHGSTHYIDPVADPLRFLRALPERLPLLLLGLLAGPGPELLAYDPGLRGGLLAWAAVVVTACGWGLRTALGSSAALRGLALALPLALLPACATVPDSRNLLFAGVVAMPLLAAAILQAPRPLAWPLLAIHGLLAPLALPLTSAVPGLLQAFVAEEAVAFGAAAGRDLVIVNAPSAATSGTFGVLDRIARGLALPRRTYVLSSGGAPIEVWREDATSLVVEAREGTLVHVVDGLFRDTGHDPLRAGQELQFPGMRVEVLAVTADGWPRAARFSFRDPAPLEARVWLSRRGLRLVPFPLPAIGERRRLAP